MSTERRAWFGPYRTLAEARPHRAAGYLIVVDFHDRVFCVPPERMDEFVGFVTQRAVNDGLDLKKASLWVQ